MDDDRRVVEFNEFSYEIWGTVRIKILARDMTLAVEKFNKLFDPEFSRPYVCEGMSILNPDNYRDIEQIRRTQFGKDSERVYEFDVFICTYLRMYDDDGDFDVDEAIEQIKFESVAEDYPEFVESMEIIDVTLEDIDYVGSGYWD